MATERWKYVYIKGERTKYQISNQNGLRSFWSGHPELLGVHLDKEGYRSVFIYHNSKRYCKKFHRLVGEYFKKNPHNYRCINHKDGNKLNNIPYNLEYCTHSYNTKHAHDTGLMSVPKRGNHYKARPVGQYLNGILIRKYVSMTETNDYGFDNKGVFSAIKLGIRHKGFEWKYSN